MQRLLSQEMKQKVPVLGQTMLQSSERRENVAGVAGLQLRVCALAPRAFIRAGVQRVTLPSLELLCAVCPLNTALPSITIDTAVGDTQRAQSSFISVPQDLEGFLSKELSPEALKVLGRFVCDLLERSVQQGRPVSRP
ncbi:hypothetical protein VTO42DRAFT_463 [Malbranchea cinnamomea]